MEAREWMESSPSADGIAREGEGAWSWRPLAPFQQLILALMSMSPARTRDSPKKALVLRLCETLGDCSERGLVGPGGCTKRDGRLRWTDGPSWSAVWGMEGGTSSSS